MISPLQPLSKWKISSTKPTTCPSTTRPSTSSSSSARRPTTFRSRPRLSSRAARPEAARPTCSGRSSACSRGSRARPPSTSTSPRWTAFDELPPKSTLGTGSYRTSWTRTHRRLPWRRSCVRSSSEVIRTTRTPKRFPRLPSPSQPWLQRPRLPRPLRSRPHLPPLVALPKLACPLAISTRSRASVAYQRRRARVSSAPSATSPTTESAWASRSRASRPTRFVPFIRSPHR